MRMRMLAPLLPLAVICFSVRYAVGRERLRDPGHLHALYQDTNNEYFGGKLPDVAVKTHDLSDEKAEGVTYKNDDGFVIVLDPAWNTSENEALITMQHESCHVATWRQ